MKTNFSAAEIMVVIDTMTESLALANWQRVLKFTPEQREIVLKKFWNIMNEMNVNIEIENIDE